MQDVTIGDFTAEVRRRRVAARLSQTDLARLSGLSKGGIQKLESRNPPHPQRPTVLCLALALRWNPDEALQLAGHEPLSAAERERLPTGVDWWTELEQLWPRLSPEIQENIVGLCGAIVGPKTPIAQLRPLEPDPEHHTELIMETPQEPNNNEGQWPSCGNGWDQVVQPS